MKITIETIKAALHTAPSKNTRFGRVSHRTTATFVCVTVT